MTEAEKKAIRDRNMAHHEAIKAKLAAVDPVWADAWDMLIVKRGKRFGLIKATKPKYMQKLGPEAGLMWEAWNHCRGQIAAARLGVGPAAMSFGGAMVSSMFCRREDAAKAFETAIDAVIAQFRKA